MVLSSLSTTTRQPWRKYTVDEIVKALHDNHGMVSLAARQLGCHRTTINNYAERYQAVRDAKQDAKELQLDETEDALFKQIGKGDMRAIEYYLSTQGKQRGYIIRQEVTGEDGKPLMPTASEIAFEIAKLQKLVKPAVIVDAESTPQLGDGK